MNKTSNDRQTAMPPNQKLSVFVGIHEVGDYTLCLSRGLRELGFQVTNVVFEIESPLLKREHSHDRYIRRSNNLFIVGMRLLRELVRQVPYHDIFVFNCTRSFFGDVINSPIKWLRQFAYIDMWLLKRLGKKVVIVVMGSELRSVSLLIEEMKAAGLVQHAKYAAMDLSYALGGKDKINLTRAAVMEKYADHIFTRPMSAQYLSRGYHPLWIPIDLRTVQFSIINEGPPLIIHAPSKTHKKGTRYVLDAIERLRTEGCMFNFDLCQNMSNIEVRKRLTRSQIAVDQLIFPGYGLFAIEAMASGNAVIGSAVPGYNGFGEDMPVLTTTPDTIYENLKRLIEDPQLRTDLALRGRKWVEKYHDHRVVTKNFIEAIGLACD